MALQNTPRPAGDYKCSMAELYAGLNIAWDSQAEHEAEFAVENTQYTAGLAVTKKAAIQAAQELPDGQARGAAAEDLRITLTEKHDVIIGKWNSLDGYIGKAFKGEHYKPRIDEAGKAYYAKAANRNWEFVLQLMVSAKNFLTAHSAVLIADGGMPAGFVAAFDTLKTEFEGLYEDFKDAQQDSQEQTDAKINANNAIYAEGRAMMEDGKMIFRKNASVRDRFVWERILELVSPSGGGSDSQTWSNDLIAGKADVIDLTGVEGTPDTMVTIAVTGSVMRFYATNMPNGAPTGGTLDVQPGFTYHDKAEVFAQQLGLGGVNTFLMVQNMGGSTGHYELTVEGLG